MITLTDKIRRARAPHACFLCTYEIRKAERYIYRTCVDADGWNTTHAHRACERYAVDEDLYGWLSSVDEGAVAEDVNGANPAGWPRRPDDGFGAARVLYAVAVAARFTEYGVER